MKTHLDLFSGIGGFALAASWAGYQTVGFCEIEDYPRRILSKRFPGVPIHRDIRELDGEQYRGVSLITGGYPCQPFSLSGKRKGTEDDRHLWPEMFRIIAQARPAWVLAENVAGHITMGLDEVLADLESEGYSGRTLVVPACAKNALHRRDRCWIIAKRNAGDTEGNGGSQVGQVSGRSDSDSRGVCTAASGESRSLADTEQQGLQGHVEQQAEPSDAPTGCNKDTDVGNANSSGMERPRSEQQAARSSRAGKDVAHTQCQSVRDEGSGQDAGKTSSLQGELRERQRIRVDPSECGTDVAHTSIHGTQGLWSGGIEKSSAYAEQEVPLCSYERIGSSYWETEPNVGRVADGVSNRVDRLKGLGNAIVPQVAYEIIRELGA